MKRYGTCRISSHLFTVMDSVVMIERRRGGVLEGGGSMFMDEAEVMARFILGMVGPRDFEQTVMDAG